MKQEQAALTMTLREEVNTALRQFLHRLARNLPWRRFGLTVLIAAAAYCLWQGVNLPIIKLTQLYIYTDEHSLRSAVQALFSDREYFLGTVVLVFSIMLPTLKLGYLLILAATPMRYLRARQKTLKRLENIGKWSMHDVLVLAITIVYLKSSGLSKAASMPGAQYFAASVVLIMIAYGWVKRSARVVVETAGEPTTIRATAAALQFSPWRRFAVLVVTLAAVVALVLGITQPTLQLTKLYVWTDQHSILSAIWALWDTGEPFLAAIIFLFSIIFPALKLFYLVVVSTLTTARPEQRGLMLERLEWLGKWSMMDVLVLALLIFYINASSVADASALPGIYFFTAAVVLTMLAYSLVKGAGIAKRQHARMGGDEARATGEQSRP